MKRISILICFLIIIGLASAQNASDAFRYSAIFYEGTAKYMSLSGATGALGADFTTLGMNPGGIGMYKKSELVVTPALNHKFSEIDYQGTYTDDSKTNFYLGNLGLVATTDLTHKNKGMKYFQFAVGFNRVKDFNHRIYIQGENNDNSLANVYAEMGNGIYFQDIEENKFQDYSFDLNLAWWTYLINPNEDSSSYFGATPPGGVLQTKSLETWGSMNEVVLSFGTNYNDWVFMGITFGFPIIRYHERSVFTETALAEDIPEDTYREAVYTNYLDTKGNGYNVKFGILLRPVNWLRIGAAVHSPTWFTNLNDNYYNSIETKWDEYPSEYKKSPNGSFSYDINTPMRFLGSAAIVFGRLGLVSAQYEYVDYSTSRIRSYGYAFHEENENIRTNYAASHNIRLGGELRLGQLALRAGASYYTSPYEEVEIENANEFSHSIGMGFRGENIYLDLAWLRRYYTTVYSLYNFNEISAAADVKNTFDSFLLTMGVRF